MREMVAVGWMALWVPAAGGVAAQANGALDPDDGLPPEDAAWVAHARASSYPIRSLHGPADDLGFLR